MPDQLVQRQILACPNCGQGKSRTTHTYGTYRAYTTNTTLVLRCKSCGHILRYKFIGGAQTITEDIKEIYEDDNEIS